MEMILEKNGINYKFTTGDSFTPCLSQNGRLDHEILSLHVLNPEASANAPKWKHVPLCIKKLPFRITCDKKAIKSQVYRENEENRALKWRAKRRKFFLDK